MAIAVSTRVDEKTAREIDHLASEKHMDRATMMRNLLEKALEEERQQLVLEQYKKREVTLARAAEMLDIDLWSMLELLKQNHIHLDYTEEELREDLKGLPK